MPADFDAIPETEWAYLAGLIDGEGCINVFIGSGGAFDLQLKISQKNKSDLHKIASEFGSKFNPNSNTNSYQLCWCGHEAEAILRKVFPYLKWKKEEAELAISFACEVMCGKGNQQNKPLGQFVKEELSAIKEAKYA